MTDATKRWLRRNRTTFAVGFGVVSVGYVAGQYIANKISEAQDRIRSDRANKENLRMRFFQNQEDCTITVLELLPTVTEHILYALPSENLTAALQRKRKERLQGTSGAGSLTQSEIASAPIGQEEDVKSLSSFQSDSYTHASQMAASADSLTEDKLPTRTKVQLWNDLKISSIVRAFTFLYTVSLLSLLTRIQLNILGRKGYTSNIMAQASLPMHTSAINLEDNDNDGGHRANAEDFETNRQYLAFSWWLLHKGWFEIMVNVRSAVEDVFGAIKPTEDLSLARLSGLILDVRRKVEGSTPQERSDHKWLSYLLPPLDAEMSVLQDSGISTARSANPGRAGMNNQDLMASDNSPDRLSTAPPPLRRMLDETSDLIDSPVFTHVLTLVLDAVYSQLIDHKVRSEAYHLTPLISQQSQKVEEISDSDASAATAKLANILAVLTREAHKIGGGVPNDYVQAIDGVNDLEALSAVIYSNNTGLEIGNEEMYTPELKNVHAGHGADFLADGTSSYSQAASQMVDLTRTGINNIWSKLSGQG